MVEILLKASEKRSFTKADDLTTKEFLALLGQRIRFHRTSYGLSRKKLAEVSGVSERYLAQLEAGQGNISIGLLRKVTRAIELPLARLLEEIEGGKVMKSKVANEELAELN